MLSAAVADHLGLVSNFLAFAALNVCGALAVHLALRSQSLHAVTPMQSVLTAWTANLRERSLQAGFCILFAFIGTFTYVNVVLVGQPFGLGMMAVGFVYFVFLP